MKRIISLLLCITMLLSSANVVLADEVKEDVYNTVSVEFSDNVGSLEKLQVMVKDDNVYANAEELGIRLGYDVKIAEEYVAIYNEDADENVPYGLTVFYYDSTKVEHMLFTKMVDSYEAPFKTIKNGNSVWIPLEYSLLLLNSSMLVVGNIICIDMPRKNIIDIYMDILKSGNKYYFDWNKDFGYTDINWKVIGSASHVVNMFNGLLDMDGATWVQFVQMFAMDSSAYDSKYSEAIAELFCTYSDKELEEEVKDVKKIMGYLNGSGTLGKALSTLEDSMPTDDDIGKLQETCQALKDKIDGSNESVTAYNKAYQALENATDKTILFDNTAGIITGVQKQVKEATGFVGKMFTVAEVVGYAKEFQNQDKFALESLVSFVENKNSQNTMSNAMKSGIEVYTDMLQQDILTYSALQYLMKNYDSLLEDAVDLSSSLGTQANLILIGWNFVQSANILNIGDKIKAANQFELATYGTIFQSDAFIDYQNIRNNTFGNVQNITPENLYEVTQSCYAYLKFCYITREAAIASLKAKTENTQEKIQPLIDYQNSINEEIAGYLVQLKNADTTNKNGCYGFLPEDNVEYLKECNSNIIVDLATQIDYEEIVTNAYNDFIRQKGYEQYIEELGTKAKKYGIVDINNDDISELFIYTEYEFDEEWNETLIFTFDVGKSEVFYISNVYNYGGIRYSSKYNTILYTDIRTSAMCGSEGFYALENNQLKFKFSVGHDTYYGMGEGDRYFFIFDGSSKQVISEEENKEYFKDLIEIEYMELPTMTNESKLLAIMNSNVGHEVENYVYVDMNHDGANELIGTYCNKGYYQTWYCSSDGNICKLVHQNEQMFDFCDIETLDLGNEIHIVLNAYMSMGTNKNYSIITLKDKEIVPVISNEYGAVYMTDKGDIVLSVEAYDGWYDPSIEGLVGHTWKNTYLFFDEGVYKEYGALEISEKEYLNFQNAIEIKEKIDDEIRDADTKTIEYKYYKRANGVMHVQCNVHSNNGEIKYGYYTIRYSDCILDSDIGEYNQGQVEANYSNQEVVY